MKTKLFILAGIGLAIASGVVMAEKKVFPSNPVVQVTNKDVGDVSEKPEPPLVITKDMKVLKGKGLFHTKEGVLYKEAIAPDGTLATTSQVVATGSIHLVDQSEELVLFTKRLRPESHSEEPSENELWILDRVTGATKKVIDNVIMGGGSSISPQGNLLAVVTNDMELLILARDGGGIVAKIGVQGVSPIFSPDGTKIAYIKLKDEKITLGDEDMFQGIAVYDVTTREDTLILKAGTEGDEYQIAGWSPDGKRIYFPSANEAVWSISVNGTGKRQETNKPGMPFVLPYLSQLLFTDDGKIAFGKAEGVWMFRLGKNGEFLSAIKVVKGVDGSMLRWFEKGKSISFHPYGATSTSVYRVSDLKQ